MKKRYLSIISLLLAGLMTVSVFTSCDSNEEATTTDEAVGATEETFFESASSDDTETVATDTVPRPDTETESETESETEILLDVEYGKTIALADKLSGTVNAEFSNDRKLATISNKNVAIEYPLDILSMGDGAIRTPEGKEYLPAVSQAFVKNKSGATFYSNDAASRERMNIYRLGSYYYEIHMLDGAFANFTVVTEKALKLNTFRSGNDIDQIQFKDGILSYVVKSASDPNLSGSAISLSTETYNALEITMATSESGSGRVYLAAGSYSGFNADQSVAFSIIPDGEFHTYYVPLASVPDYTGNLTRVRLDVGSEAGEVVRISSLKAVGLAETAPSVKLDRTYHLYSDKVNEVIRVVASKDVDDLGAVGSITKIPADTVEKLVIKDKNGRHTDLVGVDFASAEYVAFDIKGVGVYGHILLPDETSGSLTVVLEDGDYVLTQEYTLPEGTVVSRLKDVRTGHRIYTDKAHDFDGFIKAAEEERNPLKGVTVAKNASGAKYTGYDPFRGAYVFDVKGYPGFQAAYDNPQSRYWINASIKGADEDRAIYVISHTSSGNLESGALMSDNGLMLPVDLEVCKNFEGENEEPFYDDGDTAYGEIIFPYVVEANEKNSFNIINLYQNWGLFPLKQISSIQFIAPYYHLSVGTTETNCIAPYFVYGKDHWTLPDFRAMSAPLWPTQPQHTSIGRLYFLEYTTADGASYASESVDNKITAYGPTYCDIDMNYLSDDGKIKAYYRHMEMPHTDENRTYYELVLEVTDDISINDFKNDFAFFSFDGRSYLFDQLGYLNHKNECVITETNKTETPNYITLGDRSPYISYFDGPETTDLIKYVNFALVVKDYSFTLGGENYGGNLILRDVMQGTLNRMSLTLDLGKVTLKKGDTFKINMILLPWGDPSAENDDNVRRVRQDACLDPYKVETAVGSVIEDVYLPRVMSENGVAEFTVSGGANNCVVRVYGFDKLTVPTVQEKVNGAWVEYKLRSDVYDYDGYTVFYDGDGTYSYAFVINMDGGRGRTFRVTADKEFKGLKGGWIDGYAEEFDLNSLPLNVYVTPENYKTVGASMNTIGCKMEVAADNGYFRFYGTTEYNEGYVTPVRETTAYDSTGQYVVFKYRFPTTNSMKNNTFEIFTSSEKTGPAAEDTIRVGGYIPEDGEWHVIAVDVSAIESVKPREDGSYALNYFRVDLFNMNKNVPSDCYVDVAYFGACDNLEDICKLNSDMETFTLYQDGAEKTVVVATGEIK